MPYDVLFGKINCHGNEVIRLKRSEIWKDFFIKTVLTILIAAILFYWGTLIFVKDEKVDYFLVCLFCGIPFGIRRMFLWLIPTGHDIAFTLGLIAVDLIVGGLIGIVALAWRLLVAAWYIPLTIYRLLSVGKAGEQHGHEES